MPLISYVCDCKHTEKKFYRRAKDAPAIIICNQCQKEMKKSLSVPTQSSKITIDNGLQPRRVEVAPDIIEVNEAKASKDYKDY